VPAAEGAASKTSDHAGLAPDSRIEGQRGQEAGSTGSGAGLEAVPLERRF